MPGGVALIWEWTASSKDSSFEEKPLLVVILMPDSNGAGYTGYRRTETLRIWDVEEGSIHKLSPATEIYMVGISALLSTIPKVQAQEQG